jgi:serine-type D-Ala-D-Ala carboxypeptidase/endopeptidase
MPTFARMRTFVTFAGLIIWLASWLSRPAAPGNPVYAAGIITGGVLLLASACASFCVWLYGRVRRAGAERQFRALETASDRAADAPLPLAVPARAVSGAVGCAAVFVRGGRPGQWCAVRSAAGRSGRAGLAITPQTRFEIGSVTKIFTGLLLADMVVRGETELSATLGDLLDVPGPAGAATLRSLATHTSGLPRLAPSPRLKARALAAHPDPYRGIDLAHVIAAMTRNPPAPPGNFRYSNLGYQLLGAALAAVGGTTWSDLIQQRICGPLGLPATGIGPDACSVRGHDRAGLPVPYWDSSLLPGAGALLSTAADLERFLRAQLDPDSTALGPAIRLSRESQTADLAMRSVGLGWMLETTRGTTMAWHNGGTGGFGAIMAVTDRPPCPGGIAIVVNSPHTPALDRLARETLSQAH